jgi:hypothetical protein
MARNEWLAKRMTEKTLVRRISSPRVTAETTKRMSRLIFHPVVSYANRPWRLKVRKISQTISFAFLQKERRNIKAPREVNIPLEPFEEQ